MHEIERSLAIVVSLATALAALLIAAAILVGPWHRVTRTIAPSSRFRRVIATTLAGVAGLELLALALGAGPAVIATGWMLSLGALLALFAVSLRWRIPILAAGSTTRTILAVGAHPDDVELAAGGTLAKLVDHGHDVRVVVASGGEVGGNAAARPAEAAASASFLGITDVRVLDFPDTRLASKEQELTQALERIIREVRPDLLLTHSAHDQHQDHTSVHRAVLRAARGEHSILCFESPSATSSFTPSVFVDIEHYVRVKRTAVGMHADQMRKPYMTAASLYGIAAFRGRQGRLSAAEGFEPVRLQLMDTEAFS